MNKKLATILAGSAALVLTLSGCGDERDEKAAQWVKTYCGALRTQNATIDDANKALARISEGEKSPEEIKETDVKAFQDLSVAFKALSDALRKAGAPPVEDGAKLQKNATGALDRLSTSYSDLKQQAEQLNTEDQAEFADGLQDITDDMKEVPKQFEAVEKALGELREGDLKSAMTEEEGCRKVSSSPSASASAA
ncbi:hypothetical protein [Streptomyces megasporus]|uniref:hypothetical protein n=1 Tax=Streptomyces megasporus TaxID=44060 RepID=UPI0004E14898|nr:hypothetical protein [Streptomyces megasporus]